MQQQASSPAVPHMKWHFPYGRGSGNFCQFLSLYRPPSPPTLLLTVCYSREKGGGAWQTEAGEDSAIQQSL